MEFEIVTDSATDLPDDIIKKYGIHVVPTTIIFDSEHYLDGEISPDQVIQRLLAGEFAKTSQPSPESFKKVYSEIYQTNKDIPVLSIHLSSKLSGTMNGAYANKLEFPDHEIKLVDTENVSFAAGYFVLLAAFLRESGYKLEEVAEKLEKVREYVHLRAVIDDVNYLKKGGRVSIPKFIILKLFKLKPFIKNSNGLIVTVGVTFGKKQGVQKIINAIGGMKLPYPDPLLFLGHSNTPDDIEYMHSQLKDQISIGSENYMVVRISSTLICQTGPNVCGALLAPNLEFVKNL